mmetsp:Transcript_26942/g.82946  ORF Transcript_26942/g.82946 Transcript_26942/m.82946 type:complete len:237 (-) Transcript_26942:1540-2250(-)
MSCTGGACRRKSIEEFRAEAEESTEESSLSLFDLLCIGVGGTVGSGVFVLTGEVYPVAGASSMVCWLIAGAVCLMSAFSYMELSAAIPTRGSTYAFSLHALGEVWAVAGAVSLMMGYGLSGAGVARSWSVKFSVLIGTNLDVGPGYFISWTAGPIRCGRRTFAAPSRCVFFARRRSMSSGRCPRRPDPVRGRRARRHRRQFLEKHRQRDDRAQDRPRLLLDCGRLRGDAAKRLRSR